MNLQWYQASRANYIFIGEWKVAGTYSKRVGPNTFVYKAFCNLPGAYLNQTEFTTEEAAQGVVEAEVLYWLEKAGIK